MQGLIGWRKDAQEWVGRDIGTWLVDQRGIVSDGPLFGVNYAGKSEGE
jgi:hypothetical protein